MAFLSFAVFIEAYSQRILGGINSTTANGQSLRREMRTALLTATLPS